MRTTLDFGLISDGVTSVTQSTCLAWALNELDLSPEDQEKVSCAMRDEERIDNVDEDCGCEGLERFDLYLTRMTDVAQRYLPAGGRLVLRVNGPDEDNWFGVEKFDQRILLAEVKSALDSIEVDLLKHSDFDSDTIRAIFAIVRTDIVEEADYMEIVK